MNWLQTENSVKVLMMIIKVSLSFCPVYYVKNWTNISSCEITRQIKAAENKTDTPANFLLDRNHLKEFYKIRGIKLFL